MRLRTLFIIILVCLLFIFAFVKATLHNIRLFDVEIQGPACIFNVGGLYQTCSPFYFSIDSEYITIPKGHITALDTIPGWYHVIADPTRQEVLHSALAHDFMYGCPGSSTRQEVDAMFYHLLLNEGVSEELARKMYFAVRLFGSGKFNRDKACYPNPDTDQDTEDGGQWTTQD